MEYSLIALLNSCVMVENLDLRLEILDADRVIRVYTWLYYLQRINQASSLSNGSFLERLLRSNIEAHQAVLLGHIDGYSVLMDALYCHSLKVAVSIWTQHQVLVDVDRTLEHHTIYYNT